MSRERVTSILESAAKLDHGLLEDFAFGRVPESVGISIVNLTTLKLVSARELESIPTENLQIFHQIRVKTKANRLVNDIEIMKILREKLHSLEIDFARRAAVEAVVRLNETFRTRPTAQSWIISLPNYFQLHYESLGRPGASLER